jgi:hypothetical protein
MGMAGEVVLAGIAWATVPRETTVEFCFRRRNDGSLVLTLTQGNVVSAAVVQSGASLPFADAFAALTPPAPPETPSLPETGS